MVKFGFKDYVTKFDNWSKHHKEIGVHVMRVYSDGQEVLPNSDLLKKIIEENI